jgi:transposase-like protein
MIRALAGLFSARCPHCRSVEFRSVGVRNSVEQAFRWLLQPYRCSLCGHHLFLFRWQTPVEDAA